MQVPLSQFVAVVLICLGPIVIGFPPASGAGEVRDSSTLTRWEYATHGVEVISNASVRSTGPWMGSDGLHWVDLSNHSLMSVDAAGEATNRSYFAAAPGAVGGDRLLVGFRIVSTSGGGDMDIRAMCSKGSMPASSYRAAVVNDGYALLAGVSPPPYPGTENWTVVVDLQNSTRYFPGTLDNISSMSLGSRGSLFLYRQDGVLALMDLHNGNVMFTRNAPDGPVFLGEKSFLYTTTRNGATQVQETFMEDGRGMTFSFPGSVSALSCSTGELVLAGGPPDDTQTYLRTGGDWLRLGLSGVVGPISRHNGSFSWAERAGGEDGTGKLVILRFDPERDSDSDSIPDVKDDDDDNDDFTDVEELAAGTDPEDRLDNPMTENAVGTSTIFTVIFFSLVMAGFLVAIGIYVMVSRRGR